MLYNLNMKYDEYDWKYDRNYSEGDLISQDDGTIAVNADAFIINDKINYSFILSTFVGIFKERLTNYPSTTIFWLERSCIVTN